MPFLKKVEVGDLSAKYGPNSKGVFVLEKIRQGEVIWEYDEATAVFYPWNDKRGLYSKEELFKLIEQHPDSRDYILSYSCMHDDNTWNVPRYFVDKLLPEINVLQNHSCSPNCGFSGYRDELLVAIRDIEPGEELLIHYGFLDTEKSLFAGIKCVCGSPNCAKTLLLDFYKQKEFQDKYYKYSSAYVKSKIRELRPDIDPDKNNI